MKKNLVYAMMSAIALTSAVSFTACSSDDAVVENNPTYDGSTVKTQFSISFPENVASTRMTSDIVQEAQSVAKFRGMDGIVLIPYSNATNRDARLGGNITLGAGKMVKPNASNGANAIPNGQLLANSNAVLYNDVTIPVGTAGFLFYGEAAASENGTEFTDGRLTATGLDGESSGISFTPTPILGWKTGENVDPFTPNEPTMTIGNALAAYVSSIAAASYDDGTEETADDVQYIWAKCANQTNSGQPWYNAGLGAMYTAFTSMKAGASGYVQTVVQDLYSSIKDNTDKVSVAIKAAILNSTYASDAGSGTLTFTPAISGYPANLNMPEGAAALTWSSPNANEPKVATAVGGSNFGHSVEAPATAMNVVNMTNIVYPASLYYYVNSTIKTSNTSKAGYYDGSLPWTKEEGDDILDKYTDGTSVQPSTRSVAIEKPIQYAVGRLDVTVKKLKESKYYDRKGEEVIIPTDGFELTGVLIGGQKAVNYEFTPTGTTPTGTTEYTIYDNVMNTEGSHEKVVKANQDAGINYTLALETAKNQAVYVALEFQNNSDQDFQGYDGIVKKGGKFYMIAQLNPEANVADHVSGVASTGNKVFKQDFKTIANFTIGAGTADANNDGTSDTPAGFANAYTTIPDLRTPKLELGFSVDLTWQAGIQFDVTF